VLLILFLLFLLAGSVFVNFVQFAGHSSSDESGGRVQEKYFSHAKGAPNKVVILTIEGTILDGQGFVKRQIDHAMKDDNIKAMVLRVNSPGGTVTGSDYIYHHLKKLTEERKIPVVVSMGGVAASGGYYVSMAVGDRPGTIFAEPTTWTGSIGVMIPHYNAAELLEKIGVQQDTIASHRLKGMGSMARPMTEEERKIFQGLVDESFAGFKAIVQAGRPRFKEHPEELDKIATGQVFTANQALKNGLVDEIGFVEDAVAHAVKLTNLPDNEVSVVEYKPEPTLADALFGRSEARASRVDLSVLLDAMTPRSYYLCSWIPPAISTSRP
jgi:protease-4